MVLPEMGMVTKMGLQGVIIQRSFNLTLTLAKHHQFMADRDFYSHYQHKLQKCEEIDKTVWVHRGHRKDAFAIKFDLMQ
jgi:hypothetical protein